MMFKWRSTEKEWMDDFSLSGEELEKNLQEIEKINLFLGGHQVVINALKKTKLAFYGLKIMDVGCGSGDLLRVLAIHPTTKNATLIGVDANKNTIKIAQKNTSFSSIIFENKDCFDNEIYEQYQPDVVIMSLFLHHFSDQEIEKLLTIISHHNPKYIIINDLHRSIFAYAGFSLVSFLFGFSKISKHDGKISILRGFKKNEWKKLLHNSLITTFSIRWCWAFRHQIIIKNT